MYKKFLAAFIVFHLIVSFSDLCAQNTIKIATINSKDLIEFVPGKKEASKSIEILNNKYKKELELMQNDYNSKYTDFLANQNDLSESIKLRRMQELYELEQNINRFLKIAQEDIDEQEQMLIAPLREKMKEAISAVGMEQGFVCIYDLANPAISFVTPDATDANGLVRDKLQKR